MRNLDIAAEVAEHLGTEQVALMRGAPVDVKVQCWDCSEWIEPGEPAAIIVMKPVDLAAGVVNFALHTHPACSGSEIREITAAELNARRAELGSDPTLGASASDGGGGDVDVVATVFDTGRGSAYPVLMVSFHSELLLAPQAGDRVDALVARQLALGWHPVTRLETIPGPAPDGYRMRFTHREGQASAPGVVELIDPDGMVETSAYVQPARLWRPALVRTGSTVVIMGSRFLDEWDKRGRSVVKQAARAGRLVCGIVPVELVGPGNHL